MSKSYQWVLCSILDHAKHYKKYTSQQIIKHNMDSYNILETMPACLALVGCSPVLTVHCPVTLETAGPEVQSLQLQIQCTHPFQLFGNCLSPPMAPLSLAADRCLSFPISNQTTSFKLPHMQFWADVTLVTDFV